MELDTLDTISKKYKLDKNIEFGHDYVPGYTALFESRRFTTQNILEIGIGSIENGQMEHMSNKGYSSGNSLKCWSEYFPNANIYAIDLYEHNELNAGRIKTYVADQTSETALKYVIDQINSELDIIIDDGSHIGEHQVFSFMFLHKYLKSDGIYAIEDVQAANIDKFKDLSIFPNDFKEFILSNFDVRCFDTRAKTGHSGDFIISFSRKNTVTSTYKLTQFIKESVPCMFTKYGDGEHFAAKFSEGSNCDGTPYTKNLGDKIIESFLYNNQQSKSLVGVKPWNCCDPKSFFEGLIPAGAFPVNWVDYHTVIIDNDTPIHTQSSEKLNLYRAIKESSRQKIYVANSKMFRSKEIFNIDHHITVHPSNWFDNDFDNVFNSIKEKIMDDANTMILFSAGMGAKYLITALHRLYPNAIYIDVGSAFDTICTGQITRDCYSSYNDMYNYLKSIMPPPLIGKTYKWGTGYVTFTDDKTITTTWGSGPYKKYDDYVIEAEWNGYSHIVVFNTTYTEYVSTRRRDLDYTKGSLVSK